MIQEIDDISCAANVSAQRSDGFRERADLDSNPAVQAEMVDGAAAVLAEDARGVGVVDHDRGAEFFGRLDDAGQRRDVTVHREDAVGHNQAAAPRGLAEPPFEMVGVQVVVDEVQVEVP